MSSSNAAATRPCDGGGCEHDPPTAQVTLTASPERSSKKGIALCWPCAEEVLDNWLLEDLYDVDAWTITRLQNAGA